MKRIIRSGVLIVASLMVLPKLSVADLKWNVGGEVSESYDDNVTFAHTNIISDELTKIALLGGFTAQGKNEQLKLQGRLTENIFARHSSFNNLSEEVSLDGVKDLNAYDHMEVHDTFSHAEDPISFEDAFGRTNGRYGLYANNLDLTFARQWANQWTTKLKYHQSNYNYTISTISDAMEYAPGISTEYTLNSATILSANYDYNHWVFVPGKSVDSHIVYAGLRRYLTSQLYVDLKPGVSFLRTFAGKDLTKPRYEAGLTDNVNETTKLNLTYVKEYAPTPFVQDIFNNWRLSLSGSRELTERITGIITAFYGEGTYMADAITDRLSGAAVRIEYALSAHTVVFGNYTYEHTVSNIDERKYNRNMVMLGIRIAF